MTQTLKQAAKLAVMLQMKEPGSVTQPHFPKALYVQQQLDLLHKKDCLHAFILHSKKENKTYSTEETCEYLGLEVVEYEACYQALVREGRI